MDCSINGCARPVLARGWCNAHYKRWRRHGAPEALAVRPTVQQRFWRWVDRRSDEECWLWLGARTSGGYGYFGIAQGRMVLAHRFAFQAVVGPIPRGMVIDHIACSRPACVNPGHLRVTTQRENVLRSETAPAAVNARKTECVRGHPFVGTNLIPVKGGKRGCRACAREQSARTSRRRRASHRS